MARSSRQAMFPGMDAEPDQAAGRQADAPQPALAKPATSNKEKSTASVSPRERAQSPDLQGNTVYAIDANSLIFQVFHAIPEMTSPRGVPVSAVYGFTRDVL